MGFDPQGVFDALREDAPSFGLFGGGGIFGILRTLSFWKMKDRARIFGETAGSELLARIMQAAPRHVRFHLMGHSFGCIVVSATLAGPKGRDRVARPVESLALIQGALSIWSFCDDIPNLPGQPGYFRRVVSDGRVRGPILATQSVFDTATGKWYPLGAGVARQVAFATPGELPKYGAVGTHGIRGLGASATDLSLLPADRDYTFTPGGIYNLECSEFVCNGSGTSGAHSDICHTAVAHAVWQAAIAAG
jgi:pimeloyl-ACP methyl ester carboxylesterase